MAVFKTDFILSSDIKDDTYLDEIDVSIGSFSNSISVAHKGSKSPIESDGKDDTSLEGLTENFVVGLSSSAVSEDSKATAPGWRYVPG
ncbi:hypothetical protein [Endozoicomonas sp. ISHI1]|uniref:hypothetical protein n=1 Tax=Endozoicomonas sp. ISHI1 TaxID=2825882 RepID=UPI0021497D47|nr:hypothetical protein [Endozoicomonas sp. ISHI1]